jgi:hypothetical protein
MFTIIGAMAQLELEHDIIRIEALGLRTREST